MVDFSLIENNMKISFVTSLNIILARYYIHKLFEYLNIGKGCKGVWLFQNVKEIGRCKDYRYFLGLNLFFPFKFYF